MTERPEDFAFDIGARNMAENNGGHKTGDSLPEPLTPPPCDLTGLEFMPLKLQSLFDSDFYALSTGEEFKIGLRLWGKSWHEKPAASLPSDERLLAKKANVSLEQWRQIAPMALHKWVLCSDGRLYHPTVAREALKAWIERIGFRARGAAGSAGKLKKPFDPAPFDALKTQAERFLAALDPDAPPTSVCLKQDDPPPQVENSLPEGDLQGVGKSAKGRDREGTGEKKGRDKNPSGSNIIFIDDGWTLDDAAMEDALAVGLKRAEVEAAAEQHLAWWRTNKPNAKKTPDGWAMVWRSRCDDLMADPEQREKLTRVKPVKTTPREAPPLPVEGPHWWLNAAPSLLKADGKAWTDIWSGCTPTDEEGVVVAGSGHAAKEINQGSPGGHARRVLGFEIRAIDPIDARSAA